MIDVDEALTLVLSKCSPLTACERRAVEAVGCALAEDVLADVDSPPHDKALVDGFAVQIADAGEQLRVLEQVVAGETPSQSIVAGTASHIMTGAPLPPGAEAMVMVEDVSYREHEVVVPSKLSLGQHIMRRAAIFARGERVLRKGTTIRPIEVGLLCEVGRETVSCYSPPRLAVLPTGDELVAPEDVPSGGQIRNSNGPMLEARAAVARCEVDSLGIGRDDQQQLTKLIERGLSADILVLSGGVSAGVRDLVPSILKSLGVVEVFHKVRLKPGKPLWFGYRETAGHKTLVFGLPGNPISSLVCFELFVQPAIQKLSGKEVQTKMFPVRLAEAYTHVGNRPTFHPGESYQDGGRTFARPLPWRGSADMLAVSRADCLIYFEPGERGYQRGAKLTARRLP